MCIRDRERTSHFISFVDSAWLSAGLIVARNAVPEQAWRCTRLLERENYRFFYDPVERLMMHGYYVNLPQRSEYSYGMLYSEARLGSLIAIGQGEAPIEHWYRLARTFPASFSWQSQSPKRRVNRTVDGYTCLLYTSVASLGFADLRWLYSHLVTTAG